MTKAASYPGWDAKVAKLTSVEGFMSFRKINA